MVGNSISGWISQSMGIVSTLWRAYSSMIHQMMVVWVLDVAEKHLALVIAHKTDISFFCIPGSISKISNKLTVTVASWKIL